MNISKLTVGKKAPNQVNAIIEIPQGGTTKYELDKDSGVIMVDRFVFTAMEYPTNYGFIAGTKGEDGDPLDILVISSSPIQTGCGIVATPIGMLEMEDEAGIDTKILAVPLEKVDPYYGKIKDISEIDEMLKKKIKHFFDHMKELEPNKWVKTKNFLPKEKAHEEINKAMK